jgi:hypothetical protein
VEGVRQGSLEELERTLVTLASIYTEASLGGSQERAKKCRSLVITAKDHAKFALRKAPPNQELMVLKQEALLWMRTWLDNPQLFPAWVRLRRRALQTLPVDFEATESRSTTR